jgi:hypothetical protein
MAVLRTFEMKIIATNEYETLKFCVLVDVSKMFNNSVS